MSQRYSLITWVAFADFFVALSLVSFALYIREHRESNRCKEEYAGCMDSKGDEPGAIEAREIIRVAAEVKKLAGEIHQQMQARGFAVTFNPEDASLVLQEAVLFETGSWEIRTGSRTLLAALADSLQSVGDHWESSFVIVVQGHTDAQPYRETSRMNNLELSRRRARAVEDALVQLGIRSPKFQIVAQGMGEFVPLIDNCDGPDSGIARYDCPPPLRLKDPVALAGNRRIELRFGVFTGNRRAARQVREK